MDDDLSVHERLEAQSSDPTLHEHTNANDCP